MKDISKTFSSVSNWIWNFFMMNNKNTQAYFSSHIVVVFLLILIFIIFESVDFKTKALYKEYNTLNETRNKVHNVEMTIGKEYIIKSSEEYIIEEVQRRDIPLYENVKPPKRIYYDE